jgi:serine/threonine protein kinase
MSFQIIQVLRGRSFRDTLFGKVRYGQATIQSADNSTKEVPVVIKEYDRNLVEKRMTKHGELVGEDAKEELRIHSLLCSNGPHAHIIHLYDVRKDDNFYYAILEFASRGEFFPLVQHPGFTEDYARHYFKQLIVGIHHMHENCRICHRDLSLENILLDSNSNLKICDFGVAIECEPGVLIKDEPGPPVGKIKFYMPPEVFARQTYSPHAVDVWTSGIILFVMLTKVHPFKYATPADQRFQMVYAGQVNELLTRWQKEILAPAPLNLLQRMLAPPEKRISIKEILNHPYLADNYKIPNPSTYSTNTSNVENNNNNYNSSNSASSNQEDEKFQQQFNNNKNPQSNSSVSSLSNLSSNISFQQLNTFQSIQSNSPTISQNNSVTNTSSNDPQRSHSSAMGD